MPGHQPAEAYYVLEQSFKDNPSFKARKTLLRQRTQSDSFETPAAPVRPLSYADDAISSQARRPNRSPLSQYSLNGHDAVLPPTPPSNSNDKRQQVSFGPPVEAEVGMSHLIHKPSNTSTPINNRSPPTPDATPPASLSIPPRDSPSRLSSSRAESFTTAREEQSSDEERDLHSTKPRTGSPRQGLRARRSKNPEAVLGLDFERESDSSTPTQRKFISPKRIKSPPKVNGITPGPMEHIPDREWDTNLMRNVTVRRKRRSQVNGTAERNERGVARDDERRLMEREIVPKLVTGSSEEEDLEPTTPHQVEFGQDLGWPKGIGRARIRDDDSKRLSGYSTASTVVEAIVIATPPQRRRTLRHVSKNLSLRSDAGPSPDGSPIVRSNRTSLGSEDFSLRRLNHKRAISETLNKGSFESDQTSGSKPATPPIPLKHHRESVSLRSDAKSAERYNQLRSAKVRSASGPTLPSGMVLTTRPHSEQIGVGRGANRTSYDHSFEGTHINSILRSNSDKRRLLSPTRAATQKALHQVVGLAPPPPEPKFKRQTSDPQEQGLRRVSASLSKPIPIEPPTAPEVLPKPVMLDAPSPPEDVRESSSTDRGAIEEVPRISIDRSTVGTHELVRTNTDHSTLRPDEHANARHLFAQTTPFSQASDTLEVSEATAISIYPHNNNSLLVVQQVARPSGVQKQLEEDSEIPGWPSLMVQPATPPLQTIPTATVDSPLKNPRKPPQPPALLPPAINVLPATPLEELEKSPLEESQADRPGPPTRSLSFKDRARRFSETLTQPIFVRSSSIRRSYYRKPRGARQGAPRNCNDQQEQQQNSQLHPFWHPRGFWDEFSDSESESDFGDSQGSRARLPPGGDTSDVPESWGLARVLDSFRGSGGFLIGNSLGVQRHGSNNRRHHVSLPVGLGRRSSGRVVRRTSEGTLKSMTSQSTSRSKDSLPKRRNGKVQKWNPRNWQVHYVGVSGVRDMWREKQLEKRREKLRRSIGMRYVVEGAPVV